MSVVNHTSIPAAVLSLTLCAGLGLTPSAFALPPKTQHPKELCPMKIVAGTAIGPFNMNVSLESIKTTFPKANFIHHPANLETGEFDFVELGALHISFCNKKAQDIWVEFGPGVSLPKGCLEFNGQKVPFQKSVVTMRKFFGGCKTEVIRIGGTFYECQPGLRIGVAGPSSTPVQVRIGEKLDPPCDPNP